VGAVGRAVTTKTDLNVSIGWCRVRCASLSVYSRVVAKYVTTTAASTAKSGGSATTTDEKNVSDTTSTYRDWVYASSCEGVDGVPT